MLFEKAVKAAAPAAFAMILLVAGWEILAGIRQSRAVPTAADWKAAAKAVRAEFKPGDLITIAPHWAEPLGLAELGDLMPVSMVGRPDGRIYPHIFELSVNGARGPDTEHLSYNTIRNFGTLQLVHYLQSMPEVTYDLIEHYPEAQSSGGLVERRTMEINYRPRYGASLKLEPGLKTTLTWNNISNDAWRNKSRLVLWLGLHDYYARKNARGPADVVVDFDDGAKRESVQIELTYPIEQELKKVEIDLPDTVGGPHSIRIEASAASAPNHFVGVLGRLERTDL